MTESILVLRPGALGDWVLTLPFLSDLRSAHPGCRIHLVTRSDLGPLTLASGAADTFEDFGSGAWASLWGHGSSPPRSVSGPPKPTCAFAFLGTGGAQAVAILKKWRIPRAVSWDPFPPGPGVHVADHLCRARGERPAGAGSAIPALSMGGEGAPRGTGPVVLQPGAGSIAKCWKPERWAALANALADAGREVILLGGPVERDRGTLESVRRAGNTRAEIRRSEDALEAARLLAGARLLVAADSGVGHLAAALGTPTLALFGPTDPATWAPRGPHVRVLWTHQGESVDWGPRGRCPDRECMDRLRTDAVTEGALKMLEGGAESA